jgi:hypothetical protein
MIIAGTMLYGPLELTRVIFNWGLYPEQRLELIIMWLLYLGGVGLVAYIARSEEHGRAHH